MTVRRPLTREATRAVAHPLRMRILAALDEHRLTIAELASSLSADRRTVARHVRTLERLGLLKAVDLPTRATAYEVVTAPYYTDATWGELPAPAKRASMVGALLHAHSIASAAAAEGGFDREDIHYTRSSLVVDEEGWRLLSRKFAALFAEFERIERESAERLARGNAAAIDVGAIMMLFERVQAPRPHHDDRCSGSEEGLEHAFELSEALDRALIFDRADWVEVEHVAMDVERLGHQLRVLARDLRAAQEAGSEVVA